MVAPTIAFSEIQSPRSGRKSSPTGSPRPLDPPPIVQLTFYSPPQEVNYREFPFICPPTSNLWCTAELFRVPDPEPVALPPGGHAEWTYYHTDGMDRDGVPNYVLQRSCLRPRNVLVEAEYGNHLLLAGAAEDHLLLGNRSVQAHIHPQNDRIIFVFPNMGVLKTGNYVIRYRVYAHDNPSPRRIASCFGEPFTISSGGQFLGLQPATPLTGMLTTLNIPGLHGRR